MKLFIHYLPWREVILGSGVDSEVLESDGLEQIWALFKFRAGFLGHSMWHIWTIHCCQGCPVRCGLGTSIYGLSPVDATVCKLSRFRHVQLFVTPWTIACQAPLSMRFSRQESWSGLPCPPPGDLPDPEVEPASLMSPALAGGFFTTSTTWEACRYQ